MSEFESEFENDMDVQMLKRMERDQMTQTPKAEEVAEKLVSSSKWCPSGSYNYNILREMIAEALTAYADERVKEAVQLIKQDSIRERLQEARAEAIKEWENMHHPKGPGACDYASGLNVGRAEALEEAAKVADRLTAELDEETDKVFSQKFKQAIKTMNGSVVSEECAVRIRALKEKP